MQTTVIRAAADYDAAMRRIETLGGAVCGTPDGEELDVLIALAEVYEQEHFPIDPPPKPFDSE